jgi:hypothetical protein
MALSNDLYDRLLASALNTAMLQQSQPQAVAPEPTPEPVTIQPQPTVESPGLPAADLSNIAGDNPGHSNPENPGLLSRLANLAMLFGRDIAAPAALGYSASMMNQPGGIQIDPFKRGYEYSQMLRQPWEEAKAERKEQEKQWRSSKGEQARELRSRLDDPTIKIPDSDRAAAEKKYQELLSISSGATPFPVAAPNMPTVFSALGEVVKPSTAGTMARMNALKERIMSGDVFDPTDATTYGQKKSLEEMSLEKAGAAVAATDYEIKLRMQDAPTEVQEYALKLGKVISPADYTYVQAYLKKQRGEELGTLEKTQATIWDSRLREFELKSAEEKRKTAESKSKTELEAAKKKYYEASAEYTEAGKPGKAKKWTAVKVLQEARIRAGKDVEVSNVLDPKERATFYEKRIDYWTAKLKPYIGKKDEEIAELILGETPAPKDDLPPWDQSKKAKSVVDLENELWVAKSDPIKNKRVRDNVTGKIIEFSYDPKKGITKYKVINVAGTTEEESGLDIFANPELMMY